LILLLAAGLARAEQEHGEATVIEQVGDSRKAVHWCSIKSPINRLIYQSDAETYVTEMDTGLGTTRWWLQASDRDTKLTAVRKENEILIDGAQNGGKIQKRLTIDSAPWFQAISLNLRRFVSSGESRTEVWTVRSDALTAHKLVAEKQALEEITAAGQTHRARAVELRLSGALSAFWKSRYWFRVNDGVFLQFEGPSGPPGSPLRLISFQGPAEPCDLAVEKIANSLPLAGQE
jgi:hypothetical protein